MIKNTKNKLMIILTALLFAIPSLANEKGKLVIIGGGERPQYLIDKIVDLAGGKGANIIIIPNASSIPKEVGEFQKAQFKKSKAKVNYLMFDNKTADDPKNLEILSNAKGIFFSGGDQNKLLKSLKKTKAFEKIKELYYEKGGVLGGTSAGAAIMSEIMITGDESIKQKTKFSNIKSNNIKTADGFGFVKAAIIDQHFIKRKRQNRLISLALENPNLPCIGIDESTAIIVNPNDSFSVLGESTVMVFDASKAKNIKTDKNNNFSANKIIMHILQSGESYSLNTKEVIN